jgi:hypothetical protein
MSALDKVPDNLDFLSQLGYTFQIKKLPHVNYFLQEVEIPSVTLPEVSQPNPFVAIKYAGDHITYGPLQIDFKVDEDMANYRELHSWLRGLGFPESLSEYGDLARVPVSSGEGLYSDASVILTTGLANPNLEFTFRDCFPVSIGALRLKTNDQDVKFISCSATFSYTLFDITIL